MDRQAVLQGILDSLARWLFIWRNEPARIAPSVAAHCLTLGRRVRVIEPGRDVWFGHAQSMEADGRLMIRDDSGRWRQLDAGYVDPTEEEAES